MNTTPNGHKKHELEELAPNLAKHSPASAFDVPEGYFESLEDKILQRTIHAQQQPVIRRIRPARILAYAASTLLFLGMAWAAYRYVITPLIQNDTQDSQQIEVSTTKDLESYRPENSSPDAISPLQEGIEQAQESGIGTPQQMQERSNPSIHHPEPEGPSSGNTPNSIASNPSQGGTASNLVSAAKPIMDTALCLGENWSIQLPVASGIIHTVSIDGKVVMNSSSQSYFLLKSKELGSGLHTLVISSMKTDGTSLGSQSIRVEVISLPSLNLGQDACYEQPQTLRVPQVRNGAVKWHDGSSANTFIASATGKYYATIISNELPRCRVSDTINLKILPNPGDQLPEALTICNDENLRLSVRNEQPGYEYEWYPIEKSGATLFLKNLSPGTYTYVLKTSACQTTYSESISVNVEDCKLTIPNIITPNGDGYNDKFVISNLERYPNTYLGIFDRDGNKVFESNDYQNNWDAANCSNGTYYYILKISKGPISERSGTLTVVR